MFPVNHLPAARQWLGQKIGVSRNLEEPWGWKKQILL